MHRLGYTRYVAQGGDVGALVTDLMGRQAVEGLVGYHLNLLTAVLAIGDHLPKESEQERAAAEAFATFKQDGFGYFLEMATRPQTIGYALLDSPVALAAWLLDHDTDSYYKISRAFVDGDARGQSHPGQHPRQHHAVLADRHRSVGGPVVLGGRTSAGRSACERPGRLRRSPCRSASRRSPARSGLPRAAGSRRSTPTSPTSTRSTGAATSPPGRSRSSSPPRCGLHSAHCADDATSSALFGGRLRANTDHRSLPRRGSRGRRKDGADGLPRPVPGQVGRGAHDQAGCCRGSLVTVFERMHVPSRGGAECARGSATRSPRHAARARAGRTSHTPVADWDLAIRGVVDRRATAPASTAKGARR